MCMLEPACEVCPARLPALLPPMQALALPSRGTLDSSQLLHCSGTGYVRETECVSTHPVSCLLHPPTTCSYAHSNFCPSLSSSLLEQTNTATANWSPWRVKTFSIHTLFNSSVHCAVCWPFYRSAFYFTTSEYVNPSYSLVCCLPGSP